MNRREEIGDKNILQNMKSFEQTYITCDIYFSYPKGPLSKVFGVLNNILKAFLSPFPKQIRNTKTVYKLRIKLLFGKRYYRSLYKLEIQIKSFSKVKG